MTTCQCREIGLAKLRTYAASSFCSTASQDQSFCLHLLWCSSSCSATDLTWLKHTLNAFGIIWQEPRFQNPKGILRQLQERAAEKHWILWPSPNSLVPAQVLATAFGPLEFYVFGISLSYRCWSGHWDDKLLATNQHSWKILMQCHNNNLYHTPCLTFVSSLDFVSNIQSTVNQS